MKERFAVITIIAVIIALCSVGSCVGSFNDNEYTVTVTDKERVNKGNQEFRFQLQNIKSAVKRLTVCTSRML